MSFIEDTRSHIYDVKDSLEKIAYKIGQRGRCHDLSKLYSEELEVFEKVLDGKQTTKYGTPEYDEVRKQLAPALEHHYRENRHHPEHFPNGIEGMNLIDLIEMLADWKAATKRHKDDDILKSIEINTRKYNINGQLKQILLNTIEEL